ncbi:MAG: hypothetical protein SGI98_03895 [Verrucomicrobiota bacterium]|nr:hypothetical protein [Verrucomicrobiota bacterium]
MFKNLTLPAALILCLITSQRIHAEPPTTNINTAITANTGTVNPYIKYVYDTIRPNRKFEMPTAYTATLVLRRNGQMEVQKISVNGPLWRADQILDKGEVLTLVMRDDVQSGFATKTGVKGYSQIDYSNQSTKNPVKRLLLPLYSENKFKINEGTVEFIGETVTEKLELDTKAGKANLWVNRATWTPVRLGSEDGSMIIDFADFKLQAPSPRIFEIPTDQPVAPDKAPKKKN